MSLRLYDTAARKVRDFHPRIPGQVGVYLCGLTLQGPPHIGHLRGGVDYDVMLTWLRHSGLRTRYVRNVTDIEDKVLAAGQRLQKPWWAISFANERQLSADYDKLGVAAPDYEPRATGHVPQMLELIAELIEAGHAYAPGNGDVYFSVPSYREYGALSHRRPEDVICGEDGDDQVKRDPRDFALWKAAKSSEPSDSAWNSPYGSGRPGWHIECSAMSRRYLGDGFDIHGGGVDLIFPHHENEIAQSKAAGLDFAGYWVHNNMVNLSGTKMSKSLGNVLSVDALGERGFRPIEIRYYLLAPHYRSQIDYSESALSEAAEAFRRLEGAVLRVGERCGRESTESGKLCADFVAAMDDDLSTPAALASIHAAAHEANAALDAENLTAAAGAAASVRAMLEVLGLDPLSEQWAAQGGGELTEVVDALVALLLEERQRARARKDYAAADALRDRLTAAGVAVEDTPSGSRWTLARKGAGDAG